MRRKCFAVKCMSIVLAGTMVFAMAGCKLAKDDVATDNGQNTSTASEDRICGAYIMCYEDGPDRQAVEVEKKIPKGKVYVTKNEKEYQFKDLDGSYIMSYIVKEKNPEDNYTTTEVGGEIEDVKTEINVTNPDNENIVGTKLYGTIKAVQGNEKKLVAVSPIYINHEDQVYINFDERNTNAFIDSYPGTKVTSPLNETYTVTEDGKTKTYETNIEVSLEIVNKLEYVVVKELDKNDQVITTTKYEKKDFKNDEKKLKVNKNMEYLMVERHVINGEYKKEIVRDIITLDKEDKDMNVISCEFPDDSGFITTKEIKFSK